MNPMNLDQQMALLTKGAEEVITPEDLRLKLAEGRPLTVKLGMDPSAPDLHLGHAVVLRKIRQFQSLGHRAVIIIGDFTGMIGDPTGKSRTRKALTREQVLQNARTYTEQIHHVLDPARTEVVFNSAWLDRMNFRQVIELAATTTVARILEREDFKTRMRNHAPLGLHELFYPLMQAADSAEIHADVELGGMDQRFNVLMGRQLQRDMGQAPQVCLFMPLLEGLDGVEKMSKSLGNYIGLYEDADAMFGKCMQIPDALIERYFTLCTDLTPDEIAVHTGRLAAGENPRDVKLDLAQIITALYRGEGAAQTARARFIQVYSQGALPGEMPEARVVSPVYLPRLIQQQGWAPSLSQARRLIAQGAVSIDGQRVGGEEAAVADGAVLKVGKARFLRLRLD